MNWSLLSKYRTTLMGFAIMWVMYFHIGIQSYNDFVWFFHRIGFYGVDIFLFLSGIGVYFSLKKRPKVSGFYKARLSRILPAYIIVATVAYLLLRLENGSIGDFLVYISGIGYWTRQSRFDWYIPTQMLFYLLTPLFLLFYNKLSKENRTGYTIACMSASLFLCLVLYYTDCTYLWGSAVRLAIFLLGIHTGSYVEEKRKISKGDLCVAVSMFLVGTLLSFFTHKHLSNPSYIMQGLNAYPALLMMPSFCFLTSCLLGKLEEKFSKTVSVVSFPFNLMGKYSLELYLLHQQLQKILPKYFNIDNQIIIVAVTILFAVALGKIISTVKYLFKERRKSKK
ncbi:MAG: acyltransferase [Oscillospiraceae bacterium]|nr:acyltransferase [Oscillospiraceae bacterium]